MTLLLPGNPEPDPNLQAKLDEIALKWPNAVDLDPLIPKSLIDAKGDLIVGQTDNTPARFPVSGVNGRYLVEDSAQTLGVRWHDLDLSHLIPKSLVDAKGDLIVATADNTPARMAVGSDDYALFADSTAATGLIWRDVPGPGRTQTFIGGGAVVSTPQRLSLFEVGRDRVNWSPGSGIMIEIWTTYYNGGAYSRSYFGGYGWRTNGFIAQIDKNGMHALVPQMGADTLVAGNIYKREVYVDLPSWMDYRVKITYSRDYSVASPISAAAQINFTGTKTVLGAEPTLQVADGGSAWTAILPSRIVQTEPGRFRRVNDAVAWDQSLRSREAYVEGAHMSFSPAESGVFIMAGLASGTTGPDYGSIDYAWYCLNDGTLHIYESGAYIGAFGTWTTDTVLSVLYDGYTVRYYKDGVKIRELARAVGVAVHLEASIAGGEMKNTTFGPYGGLSTLVGRINRGVFSAYNSAIQYTPANTWTKLQCDTETGLGFDVSSWYNPLLYRYTPQTAGYYLFIGHAMMAGPSTQQVHYKLSLYMNGTEGPRLSTQNVPADAWGDAGGSVIIFANGTTDYFELWLNHDDISVSQGAYSGPGNTFFQGHLL